ncbi:hypothetical protein C8R34_13014 [Nitrosomonas sp. Nm84]|nr:hypothetical protein C8R34_13014 [Nitrosomonas sp. Nm84]
MGMCFWVLYSLFSLDLVMGLSFDFLVYVHVFHCALGYLTIFSLFLGFLNQVRCCWLLVVGCWLLSLLLRILSLSPVLRSALFMLRG